jgi:peptidoglycan/LPS O-acetylase OafA/YrhL
MACGMVFVQSQRKRSLAWPLIAVGVALTAVAGTLLHRNASLVLHPAVIAPAFAAIIYGVALRPMALGALENKFFVLLGEASYSFYLLHSGVIGAFGMYFHDASGGLRRQNALGLFLMLATTALVSIGVYAGIERPVRRVLRPKKKERTAAAPAVAEAGASS